MALQTFNRSLPGKPCTAWTRWVRAVGEKSSGRGSGRLTFRSSALQPRIPPKSYCNCGSPTERERRAGCSCHCGRSGACSLRSLTGSSSARRRSAVRPSHPPHSLARSQSLAAPPAAASQPLKDKGPARRSYPANPQPTTTRFVCICAAIGLCKSACSDNLTPGPGTVEIGRAHV